METKTPDIETLSQVDVPKIPEKEFGKLEVSDIMGFKAPFAKRIRELSASELQSARTEAEKTMEQKRAVEQKEAEAINNYAKTLKTAQENFLEKTKAVPIPTEFIPTQDNAKDIAGLFSLINVMGMVAGKGKAQLAMNAMNGMLEGYQKGRRDLYKIEKDKFEKNFKSLVQIHQELRKELEDAQKLAATEKEAGIANAKLAAAQFDSPILKAMLDRGYFNKAVELVKDDYTSIANAEKTVRQERQKARELEVRKELQDLKNQIAQNKQNADRFGFSDIIATNLNEAVGSILNIVTLPESSTTGIFQGQNTKGLLFAPLGAMTNSLTSEDVQRYNAEIKNFGKFASRVVSGGRVVPATVQKDFEEQYQIREGDSPLTILTKIAQMRQTLERAAEVKIANKSTDPGLKEIYSRGVEDIRKAIPFTVNDVNKYANERDKNTTFVDMFKRYSLDKEGSTPSSEPSSSRSSVNVQEERSRAKAAIAAGKDETAVRERFKKKTGEEL